MLRAKLWVAGGGIYSKLFKRQEILMTKRTMRCVRHMKSDVAMKGKQQIVQVGESLAALNAGPTDSMF